jgi:hypothetical protein
MGYASALGWILVAIIFVITSTTALQFVGFYES